MSSPTQAPSSRSLADEGLPKSEIGEKLKESIKEHNFYLDHQWHIDLAHEKAKVASTTQLLRDHEATMTDSEEDKRLLDKRQKLLEDDMKYRDVVLGYRLMVIRQLAKLEEELKQIGVSMTS